MKSRFFKKPLRLTSVFSCVFSLGFRKNVGLPRLLDWFLHRFPPSAKSRECCHGGGNPRPVPGCCQAVLPRKPSDGGRASGHRTSRHHHRCPYHRSCGCYPSVSSPPAEPPVPCGPPLCIPTVRRGARPCACGSCHPHRASSLRDGSSRTSLSSRPAFACISVSC